MSHQIYIACTCSGKVDPHIYLRLQTDIDIDGLLDILEMSDVHQSWTSAAMKNASDG